MRALLWVGIFIPVFIVSCGKEDTKGKFAGTWMRSDGGYSLVIEVSESGEPTSKYFNPKPIKVKASVFKPEGENTLIHILFDDVNYEGSYYLMSYNPEKDILEGKYFQVAAQRYYPVSFVRQQ